MKFVWNGTDENGRSVASGVLLYRVIADGKTLQSKKIILVK